MSIWSVFVSVLSFVSANDRRSPIAKLEPTGERHLIDASTATRPSIGNTWFLALIKSLVQKFTGNKPTHTTPTMSSPGAQGQKRVVPPDVDSDDASSGTGSDGPWKRCIHFPPWRREGEDVCGHAHGTHCESGRNEEEGEEKIGFEIVCLEKVPS
jgi:hypothetical protein